MVGSVTSLVVAMVSISWAAANLNLSKSNINKVIYSTDGMTSTQAAALVGALDKITRVDDAAVKEALRKLSIPDKFKLIRIIPAAQRSERIPLILLLTNPADEAEAKRIGMDIRVRGQQ